MPDFLDNPKSFSFLLFIITVIIYQKFDNYFSCLWAIFILFLSILWVLWLLLSFSVARNFLSVVKQQYLYFLFHSLYTILQETAGTFYLWVFCCKVEGSFLKPLISTLFSFSLYFQIMELVWNVHHQFSKSLSWFLHLVLLIRDNRLISVKRLSHFLISLLKLLQTPSFGSRIHPSILHVTSFLFQSIFLVFTKISFSCWSLEKFRPSSLLAVLQSNDVFSK